MVGGMQPEFYAWTNKPEQNYFCKEGGKPHGGQFGGMQHFCAGGAIDA
jgi:hypothetical protein